MKRSVLLCLMVTFIGFTFSSMGVNGATSVFSKKNPSSTIQDTKKTVKQIWNSLWNTNEISQENIFDEPVLKSATTTEWVSLGPNTRAKGVDNTIGVGRFTALWINPANFDYILAGASSGGLWKTIDGGKRWECLTDTVATGGVWDIAVDPRNEEVIYIATKTSLNGVFKFSGIYSMGIFKTTDGGKSWAKLPIDYMRNEYFERIQIDSENRAMIYALSNKAVYKSIDSGKNWKRTKLNVPDDVDLIDMEFKPGKSKTIYVSGKNGLYVSQNSGKSWTSIKENLTSAFVNCRFAIATNPANSEELYVLYNDLDNFSWSSTPNRIEKTSDMGATWKLVTDKTLSAMPYTSEICLSPKGDIYAGGMYLKRSTDGGAEFKSLSNNQIHDDIQKVIFPDRDNNNLLFVANDGGLNKDTTGGGNWISINGNLATNEFYSVAIFESNPEIMVGGTHDCGSYYRDSLGDWEYKQGGDGGTSLMDQLNPTVFYTSSNKSFCRNNNNRNYSITRLQEYDSPVAMDPTNSDILYCHKWVNGDTPPMHFMKSIDRGAKWTTLEQEWNNLTDIAISFSNPNYIYYSMWDTWAASRIRRTTNGGATWSNANHLGINTICGLAPINAILVDPFNPLKLWIAFGGFEESKKIYFSNDGGDSWSNISGTTLPNVPVQCMQYDYINQILYLGTDAGLYKKNDSNAEWQYVQGFPRAVVSSLNLNKLNGDLVASTYGRGIWRTNIGDGYCIKGENRVIDSTAEWIDYKAVCGDIVVKSGSVFTVKSKVVMPYSASIVVQPNAKLIIDSGSIVTGKLIVEEGGGFALQNGGVITEIYGE